MTASNSAITVCSWQPSIINMRKLASENMQKLAMIIVVTKDIGRTFPSSMRRGTLLRACDIEY